MKRILTLLSFLFLSASAMAQTDLSVTAINAPVSGCALTATENVTIRIFNFDATLPAGTMFDVSYTINAGVPVVETVTLAVPLTSNTAMNYTFTTQADLSIPGTYTFDATVTIAGDVSPGNDAFTGYVVTNTAPSVGGTISGAASVCVSGNSGFLTLAGETGSILRWEYSTDGGSTWINISNTSNTQAYNNLTDPTQYRAVVKNGTCAATTSAVHSITIDPVSVGGSISSNATVCEGSNSGTLTSTGRTGNIVRWEYSTDGGVTWTTIANTTSTQTYTNLTVTTRYRVVVQSGSCTAVNSSQATITVNPATVGGTIAPAATTVCSGSNSGTLTLSGHTGNVARWEYSINGGGSWINIANTSVTQSYTNLTQSRLYRARVASSPCAVQYSSIADITVISASAGGTLSPATFNVCSGSNYDTLVLTGENGTITQWEFSTDGGASWTIVANINDTLIDSNLTVTTLYRALVQNAACNPDYSSITTINVSPNTVGGTVSGGTTECASGNSGSLTLSGEVGTILGWESSNDGVTWTPIANTTNTENYNNLTDTTYYWSIVQSGVCVSDTSSVDTVFVDPVTVGGTVSPANDTVCSGLNSGTLTLVGSVGAVQQWEYSTDGGVTWITISNQTTSQAYNNLATQTFYRALVKSGVCNAAYSSQSVISITPQAIGGTLYSDATVCGGSNSGVLTLIGFSGAITQWESSTDGGVSWTPIANTANTYNYLNLVDTTMFHVIIGSGVCPSDTSQVVTITVDAPSAGGIVTLDDTVCAGANNDTLTLSGHMGTVVGWDYSVDGGITWINISNTTTQQAYLNLMQTTRYRARVANGVCPPITSTEATITVDTIVNGGTVTGSATVCSGANNGSLTLTGFAGTITGWEFSIDGGVTWFPDGNTSPTETYTNLAVTTMFRSLVTSGTCGADTSTIGTITVDPPSVGGTTSASATVCSGANNGTITLAGETGSILRWEFSTDGGNNWIAVSNTTNSLTYLNVLVTTQYRAVVQSGVCSPPQFSSVTTITVTPPSVAGTISGSTSVCEGTGSGTLTLSGNNGPVTNWLFSINNGATWFPLGNTTTTQSWINPPVTTWYVAIVQSGVCPSDTTAPAIITTQPNPVASFTATTVCEGNATVFTNTSTISSGSIQFNNWDFGDNDASVAINPVHTYNNSGVYNVTLVAISNLGCSGSATSTITVNPLPSSAITVSGSLSICQGDSVNLSVLLSAQNDYLWNTGETVNSIYASVTGNYVVTVTDQITLCSSMDSVNVDVLTAPVASAGPDTSVSAGSSIVLTGSGGTFYNWIPSVGLSDPNIATPVCTPPYTVTYTLTVTDMNGCSSSDEVTVTFVKDYNVIASNVITANADGFNDTWYIRNIDYYPANKVTVYNRNGMKVYEQEGYNNSWNGTYNGEQLPDGTYYYVLEFTDSGETIDGAVTIISEKN